MQINTVYFLTSQLPSQPVYKPAGDKPGFTLIDSQITLATFFAMTKSLETGSNLQCLQSVFQCFLYPSVYRENMADASCESCCSVGLWGNWQTWFLGRANKKTAVFRITSTPVSRTPPRSLYIYTHGITWHFQHLVNMAHSCFLPHC